ncbi:MAG: hypothetical protein ABNH21_16505 [Glaciecola sp.]
MCGDAEPPSTDVAGDVIGFCTTTVEQCVEAGGFPGGSAGGVGGGGVLDLPGPLPDIEAGAGGASCTVTCTPPTPPPPPPGDNP